MTTISLETEVAKDRLIPSDNCFERALSTVLCFHQKGLVNCFPHEI